MRLTYFSHSCFLITADSGKTILIDPFLNENPTSPVKADEVQADFILLTHGHGDHLGDTLSIAQRCGSLCICENELANYLASKGLNVHNMNIGGSHRFEFGTVKLVQAFHGSCTPDNECHGIATGILVICDQKTIYHAGDTGLFTDMSLIGELNAIDCMMVPIGDNFTMGIDDAVLAAKFARPKLVIPMHYNTFPIIQVDPQEFRQKAEESHVSCLVMDFGQELEI